MALKIYVSDLETGSVGNETTRNPELVDLNVDKFMADNYYSNVSLFFLI